MSFVHIAIICQVLIAHNIALLGYGNEKLKVPRLLGPQLRQVMDYLYSKFSLSDIYYTNLDKVKVYTLKSILIRLNKGIHDRLIKYEIGLRPILYIGVIYNSFIMSFLVYVGVVRDGVMTVNDHVYIGFVNVVFFLIIAVLLIQGYHQVIDENLKMRKMIGLKSTMLISFLCILFGCFTYVIPATDLSVLDTGKDSFFSKLLLLSILAIAILPNVISLISYAIQKLDAGGLAKLVCNFTLAKWEEESGETGNGEYYSKPELQRQKFDELRSKVLGFTMVFLLLCGVSSFVLTFIEITPIYVGSGSFVLSVCLIIMLGKLKRYKSAEDENWNYIKKEIAFCRKQYVQQLRAESAKL